LGRVFLRGYSLTEADSMLRISFAEFLTEPFVKTRFLSKRVSVIGAEKTHVVELTSETIRLSEVIALSGGIPSESRANNIKVLREDKYFVADLSGAKDRLKNDIYIHPGDSIYIEPVKRPFRESLRDAVPIISTVTSIITFIALVVTLL
jgi:polysaccharide export outer membrane protein